MYELGILDSGRSYFSVLLKYYITYLGSSSNLLKFKSNTNSIVRFFVSFHPTNWKIHTHTHTHRGMRARALTHMHTNIALVISDNCTSYAFQSLEKWSLFFIYTKRVDKYVFMFTYMYVCMLIISEDCDLWRFIGSIFQEIYFILLSKYCKNDFVMDGSQ